MYYVVFVLCALCDARSLAVPRWMLLVLCLVACAGREVSGSASPALSGLVLALPVYRQAAQGRCGIGDSAGACALGGRYGVTDGATTLVAGLFILILAVHVQRVGPGEHPDRSRRLARIFRQAKTHRPAEAADPKLAPARYPLFPALLVGDLTFLATTRLLTGGGGVW